MNTVAKSVARLGLCLLLAWLFLVSARLVEAQQPTKSPMLGYLTNDSLSVDLPRRNAFKQGLRDLGYIEGQNIIIEYRVGGGDRKTLPELMAELLRLKVDVVFAFNTAAIQAAKNATKEVPIVFAAHHPVELGVVTSLARPGGNMTGLTLSAGPEIYGKLLQLLGETVPKLSHVAVLSNPVNPINVLQLREMQSAASALGVTLHPFDVKGPDDLDAAFTAIKKERAEALIVLLDEMLLGQRQRIADLAVKSALPSMYGIPEHVDAGGLMCYAADRLDIFRRAAVYVDKILKGAKPADLPVEQPTKFDLILNLKTAKAVGPHHPAVAVTPRAPSYRLTETQGTLRTERGMLSRSARSGRRTRGSSRRSASRRAAEPRRSARGEYRRRITRHERRSS